MYLPQHFTEKNQTEVDRIISECPLAVLFTSGSGGFSANHLPFLVDCNADGAHTLLGHISIENPLFKENKDGDEVLVVYKSEDSYISPNWYPSKKKTHRVVPTWNYQSVHFHGTISFFQDEKLLLGVVGGLTKMHENNIGEKEPWKIKDAPRDFIKGNLAAIVGMKIDVFKIEAKSKLNQNKESADFHAVKEKMAQNNKQSLFLAMQKITR